MLTFQQEDRKTRKLFVLPYCHSKDFTTSTGKKLRK